MLCFPNKDNGSQIDYQKKIGINMIGIYFCSSFTNLIIFFLDLLLNTNRDKNKDGT